MAIFISDICFKCGNPAVYKFQSPVHFSSDTKNMKIKGFQNTVAMAKVLTQVPSICNKCKTPLNISIDLQLNPTIDNKEFSLHKLSILNKLTKDSRQYIIKRLFQDHNSTEIIEILTAHAPNLLTTDLSEVDYKKISQILL